jgi:hypothetical protein
MKATHLSRLRDGRGCRPILTGALTIFLSQGQIFLDGVIFAELTWRAKQRMAVAASEQQLCCKGNAKGPSPISYRYTPRAPTALLMGKLVNN